jgi:hypothetical protein
VRVHRRAAMEGRENPGCRPLSGSRAEFDPEPANEISEQ